MKKLFTVLLMMIGLSAHAAVHLSPDGKGQAIIFPYYTVANGQNTYVSITNNFDSISNGHYKAVKVNVLEAANQTVVHSFNLYLQRNDTFTFAMGQLDGELKIVTGDDSCTLGFDAPLNLDAAPASSLEWQTGLIEVISMAEITDDSGDGELSGAPVSLERECQFISSLWDEFSQGATWGETYEILEQPPLDSLSGSISIIDVDHGYSSGYEPVVMKSFFADGELDHRPPAQTLPNLASGTNKSSVLYAGQMVHTTWPSGFEAVSALLMKTQIQNEFSLLESVAAQSEWVMSFPTLVHHKNSQQAKSPFVFQQPGDYGFRSEDHFNFPGDVSDIVNEAIFAGNGLKYLAGNYDVYDRQGNQNYVAYDVDADRCSPGAGIVTPPDFVETCFNTPPDGLSHAVNTFVIKNMPQDLSAVSFLSGSPRANVKTLRPGFQPFDNTPQLNQPAEEGIMRIRFTHPIKYFTDRGVNTDTGRPQRYEGLPVFAFSVIQYFNANAQPGLLASYANGQTQKGSPKIIEDQP